MLIRLSTQLDMNQLYIDDILNTIKYTAIIVRTISLLRFAISNVNIRLSLCHYILICLNVTRVILNIVPSLELLILTTT